MEIIKSKISSSKNVTAMTLSGIILLLSTIYIVLLVPLMLLGVDPAKEYGLQYLLHISVTLTILTYFFFLYSLSRAEQANELLKLALLFTGLSLVPIFIGRALGIAALSYSEMQPVLHIFNFYGEIPISRTIEIVGWTTFFPLSLCFLARNYLKKPRRLDVVIGWIALLAAICCFAGIGIFFTSSMVPLGIGIMGWGILFFIMIAVYFFGQIKAKQ